MHTNSLALVLIIIIIIIIVVAAVVVVVVVVLATVYKLKDCNLEALICSIAYAYIFTHVLCLGVKKPTSL